MRELFCKSCQFFLKIGDAGECHRNSPRPIMRVGREGSHPVMLTIWPIVNPSDWCHDYEEAVEVH